MFKKSLQKSIFDKTFKFILLHFLPGFSTIGLKIYKLLLLFDKIYEQMLSFLKYIIKGIGQMFNFSFQDRDNIEPDIYFFRFKVVSGCFTDRADLSPGNCFKGGAKGGAGPGFYFNKDYIILVTGNNVNFSVPAIIISFQYFIAFFLQEAGCLIFGFVTDGSFVWFWFFVHITFG
jgi:hypothetical protein